MGSALHGKEDAADLDEWPPPLPELLLEGGLLMTEGTCTRICLVGVGERMWLLGCCSRTTTGGGCCRGWGGERWFTGDTPAPVGGCRWCRWRWWWWCTVLCSCGTNLLPAWLGGARM